MEDIKRNSINNMKKKWLIFSAMILVSGEVLFYSLLAIFNRTNAQSKHLRIHGPYFEPIKITEFFARIPCVKIEIAGKTTTAKVDLGSNSGISLPSDFLKEIDQKSFIRCTSYFGVRGKTYYSDVYELPKVKIGKMVLFPATAEEINPEFENDTDLLHNSKEHSVCDSGRIGWELFYNVNLFLDCEHSTIAFCDSLDTLKKQGYPTEAFIETPLLLDRNLIEFEAMTGTGPLRCTLDTGSTWNLLNKDLEGGSNDHMVLNLDNIDQNRVLNPENTNQLILDPEEDDCEILVFKIGKKDFGTVAFQKIKTSFGIDAIIGMEFLYSKLVFIDFPNRKIYFYEK